MESASYIMVAGVLIVALIFVFIAFTDEIKTLYLGAVGKSACRASVEAHSALCLKGLKPEEIKCPAVSLTIKDKKQEVIKENIAKSMLDCWGQFGKGEKEFCGSTGVYCSVCTVMKFENKEKIEGLSAYLASASIPDGTMKYADFLGGNVEMSSSFQETVGKSGHDIIDPKIRDMYATVFVQIKDQEQLDNYLKKAKYTAPGVGVVAVGFGIFKVGSVITGMSWWTGGGVVAGVTTQVAGGLIMVGGALYSSLAAYFAEVPFDKVSYVYFGPYDAESLKALGCTYLPSQQS